MCGGTCPTRRNRRGNPGLSPRVRGNRGRVAGVFGIRRSIPACAGEPGQAWGVTIHVPVYPRVCGGTNRALCIAMTLAGLSPRVRGNLRPVLRFCRALRSIPACAGEPPPPDSQPRHERVYPRVCGGTDATGLRALQVQGLSPRVRGNLLVWVAGSLVWGSIPACAGEPRARSECNLRSRVYPRVCGGTANAMRDAIDFRGLSPRVRGNRAERRGPGPPSWSIPACAGEPETVREMSAYQWVYPRVCGGTFLHNAKWRVRIGLSPRVRGNHHPCALSIWSCGSIPACAGEPGQEITGTMVREVYPRVCGGTTLSTWGGALWYGLSPRVRGNLSDRFVAPGGDRSIPACAGEPLGRALTSADDAVYPRVCGGTPPSLQPL